MVSTGRLKRLSSVAAAVLAAFAALAAAPARAATDVEQAEALIRDGVKLRARDNAAQALPLFEKAYQISRSPRTAAQLGLCELELGYYAAAERYLNEALAAPDHPWIAKNKAALKKPLEVGPREHRRAGAGRVDAWRRGVAEQQAGGQGAARLRPFVSTRGPSTWRFARRDTSRCARPSPSWAENGSSAPTRSCRRHPSRLPPRFTPGPSFRWGRPGRMGARRSP